MRSTLPGPLVCSEFGHRHHFGAVVFEQIDRNQQLRPPRAEDRGDLGAVGLRGLGQRRERRKPGAASHRHDVPPSGIERKAGAERPHDVEVIAGLDQIQPARSGARHLVEKLDLAFDGIGAVEAHRPPQERLFAGRMRTEQLKELPGLSGSGDLAAINDEMAIFGVDRGVGDDLGELGDDAGLPGRVGRCRRRYRRLHLL